MPNAKRPTGPTKPTHLVRENAIEREQLDEALNTPAGDMARDLEEDVAEGARAAEEPTRSDGRGERSGGPTRSDRAR